MECRCWRWRCCGSCRRRRCRCSLCSVWNPSPSTPPRGISHEVARAGAPGWPGAPASSSEGHTLHDCWPGRFRRCRTSRQKTPPHAVPDQCAKVPRQPRGVRAGLMRQHSRSLPRCHGMPAALHETSAPSIHMAYCYCSRKAWRMSRKCTRTVSDA